MLHPFLVGIDCQHIVAKLDQGFRDAAAKAAHADNDKLPVSLILKLLY
jgi:hypothetical protein